MKKQDVFMVYLTAKERAIVCRSLDIRAGFLRNTAPAPDPQSGKYTDHLAQLEELEALQVKFGCNPEVSHDHN